MDQTVKAKPGSNHTGLPAWLRQPIPDQRKLHQMKILLEEHALHSVCASARCPNIGRCWQNGTVTFMILGNICTRCCRFCAVKSGSGLALDPHEPENIARAVSHLKLSYVVITSVTRDDLEDQGVAQFIETIRAIRGLAPATKIEVLIPDFGGRQDCVDRLLEAGPDVVGHNMETVRRLFPLMRPQADYERSFNVLRAIKSSQAGAILKSGLMVGLGESPEEVIGLLSDFASLGVDICAIGQYLAPTTGSRHVPVTRYVHPEEFEDYKRVARDFGITFLMSGPLVRSSYLAEQGYLFVRHSSAQHR